MPGFVVAVARGALPGRGRVVLGGTLSGCVFLGAVAACYGCQRWKWQCFLGEDCQLLAYVREPLQDRILVCVFWSASPPSTEEGVVAFRALGEEKSSGSRRRPT